jgi:phage-related protein (TIGR01555 family)
MGKRPVKTAPTKKIRSDALVSRLMNAVTKVDGWQNVFTGKGVSGIDKRLSTVYAPNAAITMQELDGLYRDDGLARRILSLPIDDMVRNWFRIEGDTDNMVVGKMNDLGLKTAMKQALRWADLYGGSLVVMGLDDGQEFEQPLNVNALRDVKFVRVYDRWQVDWNAGQLYNDPAIDKYGLPMLYRVTNSTTGMSYIVHETRCLRFDGADLPERLAAVNNGWGDSVFVSYYERLLGLGDAYGDIESIIGEFIIGILSIDGLQELIATGQEQLVKDRLNLLDLSKHIMNTMLLDTNEKMERVSATVTGIESLVGKLESALSAVSGIPKVLLFGEQSQGLGSEASGSIRLYYDDIAARQEEELRDPLEYVSKLIQLSSEGPTRGRELEGWALTFNPLWQPTQEELVKTRYTQAQTDEIYINTGVLQPGEVVASRFGGESYSHDTTIDESLHDTTNTSLTEPEPAPEL